MKPIKKTERAQSFVELALIIPVMLIFVAGVVDLGRFFWRIWSFVMLLRKARIMRLYIQIVIYIVT
jgi:hypothetical protein